MKPTRTRIRLTQTAKFKKRATARAKGGATNQVKKTLSDAIDKFFKPLQ
mgnify:FL=1